MAVTRGPQTLVLGASADEVTGTLRVQALWASGAVAGVSDSAGNPIWAAGAAGHTVHFAEPITVQGIKRGAGAGSLYVYLT